MSFLITHLKYTFTVFIHIREMSGKLKLFQHQGIITEFEDLSGKWEILSKYQGNGKFCQNVRKMSVNLTFQIYESFDEWY